MANFSQAGAHCITVKTDYRPVLVTVLEAILMNFDE